MCGHSRLISQTRIAVFARPIDLVSAMNPVYLSRRLDAEVVDEFECCEYFYIRS